MFINKFCLFIIFKVLILLNFYLFNILIMI